MKTKFTFALLLGILLVSFLACDGSSTNKVSSNANNTDTVNNDAHTIKTYRISADSATTRILNYSSFVDSLKDSLSTENADKLVYGAAIHFTELYEAMSQQRGNSPDSIYFLLATDPKTKSADLILAYNPNPTSNMPHLEDWVYFDFTRPCPQYCPNWWPTTETSLENKN